MKRLVIMTIGKTHSGKTTFGKQLEKELPNSIVIDQDNHATFLNTHYEKLVPTNSLNKLKIGLSQYILKYSIDNTDFNIVISSSNLSKQGRLLLFEQFFPSDDWTRIFVYFNYSNDTLQRRIAKTTRSTSIFRNKQMTFESLLVRHGEQIEPPSENEADIIIHVNEQHSPELALKEIRMVSENIRKV